MKKKKKMYLNVESIHGVKIRLPIHQIQFTMPNGMVGFRRESGNRRGLAAVQLNKETLEEVERLMREL